MAKPIPSHWALVPAFALLFQVLALPAAADGGIPWPKSCRYSPAPAFTDAEKSFCLNFASDYFYRLRFRSENHKYEAKDHSEEYNRPQMSTEGALFLTAMAQIESGWADSVSRAANNYWGLGGAYIKKDGKSTFMKFSSFNTGFAYLLNHLERGITTSGEDDKYHPGWPGFLYQMTQPELNTRSINAALHTGPWCSTYPAYNTDTGGCTAGKPGSKECPCVDYAAIIRDSGMPRVVAKCLAVYERYPDEAGNSLVLGKDDPVAPLDRRRSVRDELAEYARGKCGIPSKDASGRAQLSFSLASSVVSSVSDAAALEAITISGHPLTDCGGR